MRLAIVAGLALLFAGCNDGTGPCGSVVDSPLSQLRAAAGSCASAQPPETEPDPEPPPETEPGEEAFAAGGEVVLVELPDAGTDGAAP